MFWKAFGTLQDVFDMAIENYFNDPNLRNLIDYIQADVSAH